MKILTLCLGNICRSPMAEGIFRHYIDLENLDWEMDSAGTSNYHIGEAPDSRSIQNLKEKKIDISFLKGRQIKTEDFHEFDFILAMDQDNFNNAMTFAPMGSYHAQLELMLDYLPDGSESEVPDPYFGGEEGFEHVYQLLDQSIRNFIKSHKK